MQIKKGPLKVLRSPGNCKKLRVRYLNQPRPENLKIKNHLDSLSFNLRPSLEEEILP